VLTRTARETRVRAVSALASSSRATYDVSRVVREQLASAIARSCATREQLTTDYFISRGSHEGIKAAHELLTSRS
jgi:hypothetical protein